MANEGMDLCECVWGHELAMRRLLNLLRNSQAYCTDAECFEEGTSAQVAANAENTLLMTVFFMVAILIYYFRPRTNTSVNLKPERFGNGSNGNPPCPPPAAI